MKNPFIVLKSLLPLHSFNVFPFVLPFHKMLNQYHLPYLAFTPNLMDDVRGIADWGAGTH